MRTTPLGYSHKDLDMWLLHLIMKRLKNIVRVNQQSLVWDRGLWFVSDNEDKLSKIALYYTISIANQMIGNKIFLNDWSTIPNRIYSMHSLSWHLLPKIRPPACTRLLQLLFFILFTPVTLILALLRATDWSDWPAYIQQIWAKYFWTFYLEKNFPTMHCQRHLHCNCTGV